MNKTRKLIIVGDSAFAEVAFEYFSWDSDYEVVAFSVEQAYLKKDKLSGLPVVPFEQIEKEFDPSEHSVYVAITYTQLNRLRTRLWRRAREKGYSSASYVSPRAVVWPSAWIGEHCFIFENNVIQPFARIGHNVVMWSGNHIGHHSVIGDNCFISSQVVVSGFAKVGDNSFLGVNSSISNDISLGKDNWVSPGVCILKDTPPNVLWQSARPVSAPMGALEFFRVKDLS